MTIKKKVLPKNAIPSQDPQFIKRRFIHALAELLSRDEARKSIDLELKNPYAIEWAKLRGSSPIFGYTSVEDTENQLLIYFGIETERAK